MEPQSMIGRTISQYTILEKLGEGGMDIVYKAHDAKLDRFVALKFLPHGVVVTPEDKARFIQEARAASAVMHPNVCVIYDIAEHEGQQFIVMEYVEGVTLREKIAAGTRLPSEHSVSGQGLQTADCIGYAIQIGEALQEAHSKGIVHRDIKAENIMVSTKKQVKVMDFGLAKLKGSLKLTKTSSTVGTLAYMAPEQIQGGEVDARSDIFSFGVVLYEMLAGHMPFRGEHEAAMVYSIVNEEPTPIQKYLPDVSSELVHIVNRALEKDPEERYQSVHDMVIDLRRLKKQTSRVSRVVPAFEPSGGLKTGVPTKVAPRIRWLLAGVVVIVLAVVAYVVFWPSGEPVSAPTKAKSLAVVYFENRTHDKELDKNLVSMLITNLSRNSELTVVSELRLFDLLKSLGKQDAADIGRTNATDVAKRAGAKNMMVGQILEVGAQWSFQANLIDVETGNVVNSAHVETAPRPEELFSVADKLTAQVGEWLRASPNEALRISDAATNSYEAYKYYETGLQHIYRWEIGLAIADMERAVSIDTTFASAYLSLGWWGAMLEAVRPIPTPGLYRAREYLAKAKRYGEKLPDKDRRFRDAAIAWAQGNFNTSEMLGRQLIGDYPQEKHFLFFYSVSAMASGHLDHAIHVLEQAIELDRSYGNAYNQLGYAFCLQRNYEKAFWYIKTYLAIMPDAVNPYDSGFEVYVMAGRFDEALKLIDEALKRWPKEFGWFRYQGIAHLLQWKPEKARERFRLRATLDPAAAASANVDISTSFVYEGRLKEAVDVLHQEVERRSVEHNKWEDMDLRLRLAKILLEQNRYTQAEAEFAQANTLAEQIYKGMFNSVPLVVDFHAGLYHLRKGENQEAKARAARIKEVAEKNHEPHYLFLCNVLTADICLTEGKAQEALDNLERLTPVVMGRTFPPFAPLKAAIYMQLGDKSKALQVYDDAQNFYLARNAAIGGDPFDFFLEQSKLDYHRAQVYQHFGDNAEAIKCYEKAIHNWRNADKDYVNLVDAKARLAKLTGKK